MIVVAGESLIDLVVGVDGSVGATAGGSPYNVACALGRLGVETSFIGRLSTDAFGRILRARLVADGVDLGGIVATDDPTLLAIAELDADGVATYRFHTHGTAAVGLRPDDVRDVDVARAAAVHVGSLGLALEPMAETLAELVVAAGSGPLVAVDPNVRPSAIADPATYRARLERVLARADLVKASVDDLAWLAPAAGALEAARHVLDLGPAAVLVTDGPRPVRIVTPSEVTALDVPVVPIVDTIGAGDAFAAGFLAAWVGAGRGRSELADMSAVADATRFAIRVGARTVGRAGADPPRLGELDDLGPD